MDHPSPPGVFIPPVIDLIDPDSLFVSAPLDEADVGPGARGLPARITMDAFRGRSFAGTLAYVSSFVETRQEQNRTLTVEAVFDRAGAAPQPLPGLSADVEVILDAREDGAARADLRAPGRRPGSAVVRGRLVVEVAVQTGLRNWEFTEVTVGARRRRPGGGLPGPPGGQGGGARPVGGDPSGP